MIQKRTTAHSEPLSSDISSISIKLYLFLPIRTTDAVRGCVDVGRGCTYLLKHGVSSPVIGSFDCCLSPHSSISVSVPDGVK